MQNLWNDPAWRGRNLRILLWSFALLVVARLPFLIAHVYSLDEYGFAHGPNLALHYLKEGRFGGAALYGLLSQLGADVTSGYHLYTAISVALEAVAVVLLANIWSLTHSMAASVAVGLLAMLHPYNAELFLYRQAPLTTRIGLVLALGGLLVLLLSPSRRSAILGVVLLVLSLAFYQVVLNTTAVIVLLGLLMAFVMRGREPGPQPGLPQWFRAGVGTALSVPLYLVANKLVIRAVGAVESHRGALLGLEQLGDRARETRTLVRQLLISVEPLVSPLVKWILLALAGSLLLLLAFRGYQTRRSLLAVYAAVGAVVLATSVVASFGLGLALKVFWPTARVLAGIGFVWAGVFALNHHLLGRVGRGILLGLSSAILVGFVVPSQGMVVDLQRVNMRDHLEASRIIGRLETLPGYTSVKRFAVVGHHYTSDGLKHVWIDLNLSALSVGWVQPYVFSEITGRSFTAATPEERAWAESYCKSVEPWPGPNAVRIEGELAIACF